MISRWLETAFVQIEDHGAGRAAFVDVFAPRVDAVSDADWLQVDALASVCALWMAAPSFEDDAKFTFPGQPVEDRLHPDYFLAGVLQPRGVNELFLPPNVRFPVANAADDAAAFLHLTRLHQMYFGAVSDAMTAIANLWSKVEERDDPEREFRRRIMNAIAADKGEFRKLGYARSAELTEPAIAGAVRVMSEFYVLVTQANTNDGLSPLAVDAARTRFSRFLTSFESLTDALLVNDDSQPFATKLAHQSNLWSFQDDGVATLPLHPRGGNALSKILPGVEQTELYTRASPQPRLAPA